MPRVPPFHPNQPEYQPTHRDVYHDDSGCISGRPIEPEHGPGGTGWRPRCDECVVLEAH